MVNIIKPRTGTSTPGAGDFNAVGEIAIDTSAQALYIKTGASTVKMIGSPAVGSTSIVTTGALDAGSITSGFGAIDNGTSGIRTASFTAETSFLPDADDGATLGSANLNFSDLYLADGAVINLGDDQDVTLTHVADTGLLLNSSRQLQFGDSGTYIHQSADGVLDLVSDSEIEINATLVDINANADVSGTLTVAGNVDINGGAIDGTAIGANSPSTGSFTGLVTTDVSIGFGDPSNTTDTVLTFNSSGNDGVLTWDQSADKFEFSDKVQLAGNSIFSLRDGATYIHSPADNDLLVLAVADLELQAGTFVKLDTPVVDFEDDGVILKFGDDSDVTLTHVADTGLTLTHHGTSDDLPLVLKLKSEEDTIAADETIARIDFEAGDDSGNDAILPAASIAAVAEATFSSSDNSTKLTFGLGESVTSVGRTCFTMDHDGDFHLNRDSRSIKFGDSGTQIALTHIDNTGLSTNGDFTIGDDLLLDSDAAILKFGDDQDVTLTHVADTGLLLNSTNKIQFNDASQFIHGSSNAVLSLGATDEIDLTATAIDINGTANISGTLTLGTVAAAGSDVDKFLVLDGSGNVDYRTGAQTASDIGALALDALSVGSEGSASGDGAIAYNNSTGVFTYTPPAHDSLSGFVSNEHIDHTGVTLTAGDGLSGGGTIAANRTFAIDISEYSAVTPASGDSFLTLDSNGSTEQLTTVDALATLLAGTNISASSGVLSVGTLNQDTTGNAATATTLASARTIAGVSFNGSANISLNNNAITNGAGYTTNTGDVTLSGAQTFTGAKTFGTTNKLLFRDSGLFINSSADGTLDIVSDDEIFLKADDNVTATVKDTFRVRENTNDHTFLRVHPDDQTLELFHDNSSTNAFKILLEANGATTMSTADSDGTAGHFELDVDGNITLDADGGTITFSDAGSSLGTITSSGYSGNAGTATTLATARNIGGVSFNGSANINLPGVNTSGSQDTSGNAATATALATARTINGTSFDGTGNITLGNDSVTNAMMADDAIDTAQLADSAVNTARLAADAVTGAKIADDAINSEHYTDGSIDTAHVADNAITLAKMAGGTDGTIITFDASGNPVAVGPGSDGQVLTSTGAGSPPAFEDASGGGGGTPTAITVAATTDSTCFVGLFESATGDLGPKTDGGLLYDASANKLAVGGNIETGSYLQDDAGTLNLAAASTSYSIYFRGGTTTKFRMGLGSGSSWYFRPTSADSGYLGTSSKDWNRVYSRGYHGYDGSSYSAGVTMADQAGNPTTASFSVTDGSGAGVDLNLGISGGIVALADMQPSGAGSDIKLKENVQDYSKGLSFVESLPSSRTWDWKDSASEIPKVYGKSSYGYVAQELESVGLSEYVTTIKPSEWDSIDDSVEDYKAIEYVKLEKDLLYSLVNSVKELSARVKELENK